MKEEEEGVHDHGEDGRERKERLLGPLEMRAKRAMVKEMKERS